MKSIFALVLLFTVVVAKSSRSNDLFCDLCVELVTAVEYEVEQEEPNIEQKANEFCDQSFGFNDMLDTLCKQLVDQQIESIVKKLENDEKPADICAQLRMCRKSAQSPFRKH